jgi:hypothetical protein
MALVDDPPHATNNRTSALHAKSRLVDIGTTLPTRTTGQHVRDRAGCHDGGDR